MIGRGWEFWIDRGGTFTDVVARSPAGELTTLKLLSVDPERYDDAAVAGIERLLAAAPAGERRIAAVKMGTTVATNALLERRGEPTVLVITAGLEDAIRIGGQQRPEIFALEIALPEMLYVRVVGAVERIDAQGQVQEPLDAAKLRADLEAARATGLDSAAIVLLHGYRFPQHELAAEAVARSLGFKQVSVSHHVLPLPKLVVRGDTTLADAYLSPVLDRYVASVRRGLAAASGAAPLYFMQSHGGLAAAEHFRGKDSLLSGPAGGVIGMVRAARAVGVNEVIGFDMGGTSTDVALYAGELERTTDAVIASVRVSAPMLKIQTVAAGGGSILSFGQGRLRVGPESAGALPGPRCYRHGGPLTVTDANLLLGRIHPEYFPHVFGPNADEPLDADATNGAFAALARDIAAATGDAPGPEQVAAGFVRIAVERMANAIKQISVQRGHDVTRFALCCFGGAGGQHAAQVAETLGIHTVIIHPLAGGAVRLRHRCGRRTRPAPDQRRGAARPGSSPRRWQPASRRSPRARSKRCASKAPTQRTRGSSGACSSKSPEPIRPYPSRGAPRRPARSSRLRFASCTRGISAFAWQRTRRSSSSRSSSKPSFPGSTTRRPRRYRRRSRSSARSRSRAARCGASINGATSPSTPERTCRPARA